MRNVLPRAARSVVDRKLLDKINARKKKLIALKRET